MPYYKKHIFFCTNQRQDNLKCCNNANATDLYLYAKTQHKKLGLKRYDLRINQTGCLGRCSEGPVLVIYPEAVFYTYATEEDIDKIFFSYIQNNCIVKHLQLKEKE